MNTHIPSHLAPYLEEYEKQETIGINRLEELRHFYLSKRDGMSRTERRAWQRTINKATSIKKKKVSMICNNTNCKYNPKEEHCACPIFGLCVQYCKCSK